MRLPAFLLIALLAAAPAAGREPVPITRSELETLSEEALARRIFGPLGADLYVTNMTREGGRRWEGGRIWFWTKPRKDWLRDGLCVSDRMIVHLAPDRLAVGKNPALHIAGVETETAYIVRDLKMATRLTGFDPDELKGQDEACAKLDPRRDSIPADSGWQMMRAFELMKKLGDGARVGRAPVPIDCAHIDSAVRRRRTKRNAWPDCRRSASRRSWRRRIVRIPLPPAGTAYGSRPTTGSFISSCAPQARSSSGSSSRGWKTPTPFSDEAGGQKASAISFALRSLFQSSMPVIRQTSRPSES